MLEVSLTEKLWRLARSVVVPTAWRMAGFNGDHDAYRNVIHRRRRRRCRLRVRRCHVVFLGFFGRVPRQGPGARRVWFRVSVALADRVVR
jgi:hypothetical protein